jgi:hypothetical protein
MGTEAAYATKDGVLVQRHRNSCGATCVAIRTGRDLADMERLVGVRCTKAKDLASALRTLGFDAADKLRRTNSKKLGHSPRAGDIVRIKWDAISTGHWAVKAEGGYLDPIFGLVGEDFYHTKDGRRGKVTGFIRVRAR